MRVIFFIIWPALLCSDIEKFILVIHRYLNLAMHIAVIGTGYVGLVTGACFAEFGVDVTCVDVDTNKIEKLKNGVIPIYEPGLDQIVDKNIKAGRLHFTTDIKSAVEPAEVVFLAVGTPPKEDGSPDMSFYRQAAKDVAEAMN